MASLDEEQLDRLLADKVHGARVVRIIGHGFFALIPHRYVGPDGHEKNSLGTHYLGDNYGDAYTMLKRCWEVRERY